jgi:gliding motility-associated-like protein
VFELSGMFIEYPVIVTRIFVVISSLMRNLIVTLSMFLLLGLTVSAQEIWMHPNSGQWDSRILYKIDLNQGEMYIEKDGFMFNLHDARQKMSHSHEADGHDHGEHEADETYLVHAIKSKFIGSSWQGEVEFGDSSGFYRNYIIGNDPSRWASKQHAYSDLAMIDFYPGIDLLMDGKKGELKYSLLVEPEVAVDQISIDYSGQFGLTIDEDGNLHVETRFGEIIEGSPIAWAIGPNGKEEVEIEFEIDGTNVRFNFPEGYDSQKLLLIDPSLTFSTFSGSTADNWGLTAAPDPDGNLFAGGIVFGTGYPISPGAHDATFNGGLIDLGISKFNATGTAMMYSTYIGGSGSETPNSIVSSPNGELYLFGLTSSFNFPMVGAPYDPTFNGGPSVNANGLDFSDGSDLYVARLNAAGTALISSTYVGGSGTDGLNNSSLKYNYGDEFRGEIILDGNGDVYVASTSQSVDFPIVLGSQPALSGTQDAVLFKMTPNLNTMLWSTYFGGSGQETGNAVQISSTGDVYIAGGSSSATMPFFTGNDLTFNGGLADGYVSRFNGANGGLLSGTYMGLNEYDQTYFVQLDIDDNVYVLGQSESDWGVTPGLYGNPNSGQFIRKYDATLNTIAWTTMIGAGSGSVEISPTAFLVSDCYDIYLSGWGGVLNASGLASNSSTFGFPVTPDAFQAATNGSNFYIAVLGQDASILKYGTYMGGVTSSNNHVDGGTSRFDKSGRIYHAVCGACGGSPNGFTTTPGVWAPLNPSPNCNLAAFKFELSTIEALVSTPNPIICIPDPVIFNNNSANGNLFEWDFGDGTTSNDVNPVHFYATPGDYIVTLVVSDTNGCFSSDSITFVITIGDFQGGVITPPGPICPGESYQFEAFGGATYLWSPAQYLDDPNIAMPTATVDQTTLFTVIVSDSCGTDTVTVTLEVFNGISASSPDTSICLGNDVNLFVVGGATYTWTPATYLDDPFSGTPLCTPLNDITYNVEIVTPEGCVLNETIAIDVFFTPPVPVMPDTVYVCEGSSLDVAVSGGDTYSWSPNINITPITGPNVTISPTSDMYYYCDFVNACGSEIDSMFAVIKFATIVAGNDTTICPGQTTPLWATGGISYSWSPIGSLNSPAGSLVYATPSIPTMYQVIGVDQYGCVDFDSVSVDLFPQPFIQTVPDIYALYGDQVQLGATSSTPGPYVWYPSEFLSCVVCPSPTAMPNQNYWYTVTYTDQNGCSASDSINIYYDPILYIPNTFTPDSNPNGLNSYFQAIGSNIADFKMDIYNRWGELIRTLNSLDETWDGTYNGAQCQDGTYTWKVVLTDFEQINHVHVGHVNLLR